MPSNKQASAWIAIAVGAIYTLLFTGVLIIHLAVNQAGHWLYISGFIVLATAVPIAAHYITGMKRLDNRYAFYGLLAMCFLVKLLWVLNFRTVPKLDYLTFYRTAQMLAESWTIDFHYVALFPHIMGYSTFLSLFFKVFGDGLLVAPVVNVVLSTISMALIYYIGGRLLNRQAAIIASVLWILYPSQTLYNALVLSDPLYTTLILAFWAMMIRVFARFGEYPIWKVVLAAGAASLLLGAINATRPLAVILYIALIIWLLVSMDWRKQDIARRAVFVLVIGVGMWGCGQLNAAYNNSRLGEEAATTVGFNIYVGFNEQSRGKWNQQDSDRLFGYVDDNPHWTADDVQRQMLADAKERILNGNIPFIRLFYDKILLLWEDDSMAFIYSDIDKTQTRYISVSNAYYFFTMLFSIVGLAVVLRKNHRSAALMLILFVLGLTAAHLFSEVHARYHYSGTAVLAIMSGIGIGGLGLHGLRTSTKP